MKKTSSTRRVVALFKLPARIEASNYSWVLPYLDEKPGPSDLILEIGSRDAVDALWLHEHFGSEVIAFEPEPANFKKCLDNIKKANLSEGKLVEVIEKCLVDVDGKITFKNILEEKYDNPGAGSIFEIDFSNRRFSDPDRGRKSVQGSIRVDGVRFDSLNLRSPHSIFMDVQGSELRVLQGFGKKLNEVKIICFETTHKSNFVGGTTFREINTYLSNMGFKFEASDAFGMKFPKKLLLKNLSGEFNVLYTKKKSL